VLEILKMTMTPNVEKKDPKGQLQTAGAGDRTYAHLVVRNRRKTPQTISIRFTIAGEERATVDLDVAPSWSFRTWGYVTPQKKDVGKTLDAEVFERGGRSLGKASLKITPKAVLAK